MLALVTDRDYRYMVAVIVVPMGAGGLIAGVAVAVRDQRPAVQILGWSLRGRPVCASAI